MIRTWHVAVLVAFVSLGVATGLAGDPGEAMPVRDIENVLRDFSRMNDLSLRDQRLRDLRRVLKSDRRPVCERIVLVINQIVHDPSSDSRTRLLGLVEEVRLSRR